MIFVKNYFVSTTKGVDFIPILHDIRFALRDSKIPDGLLTIHLPGSGAGLLLAKEETLETLKQKFSETLLPPALSLPFQKAELVLEPKQMIYLVDTATDEKRREFFVQVLGESPQAASAQQKQQGGKRR